jgi:hypothetical protein
MSQFNPFRECLLTHTRKCLSAAGPMANLGHSAYQPNSQSYCPIEAGKRLWKMVV